MSLIISHHRKRFLYILAALFCTLFILTIGRTVLAEQGDAITDWTRDHEPVILTGSQLPSFDGVDITDIYAYSFVSGAWGQIPFQIDEVNVSGTYTVENGLLDGNDELVFMSVDAGEAVGIEEWIPDADSQNYDRYQVQVANPLIPTEIGYVYIYQSATLVPTYGDYVDWNSGSNRIEASVYELGVSTAFPGVDFLSLNGNSTNILDRSKIRANVTCWTSETGSVSYTLTEDDMGGQGLTLTPSVDGAVRVGGGAAFAGLWAYKSFFQIQASFEITSFYIGDCPYGLDINMVRMSFDLWNPSISGGSGFAPAKYYDSDYGAGVNVDGNFDVQIGTDPVDWTQISGDDGTMVQMRDISIGGGTIENYYLDHWRVLSGDTGIDEGSYGDSGVEVLTPSGLVSINLQEIILDRSLPNVGDTYQGYKENPLQVMVEVQSLPRPFNIFLPLVMK